MFSAVFEFLLETKQYYFLSSHDLSHVKANPTSSPSPLSSLPTVGFEWPVESLMYSNQQKQQSPPLLAARNVTSLVIRS